MKYPVILLILASGGLSGYFIGDHRGKAATETLATLQQAAKQQKAESDKTINALRGSVAQLSTAHKSELDKIETEYQRQRAKLDEALAGKEKRIKELTAKMDSNQLEIGRLRDSAVSATDPAEKQKLLNKMAKLENETRNSKSNVEGLKCLSAAVPDEILSQLQED